MKINSIDHLSFHSSKNDDGTHNGSIISEEISGQVYALFKAPRYVSDEDWEYNCELVIRALKYYLETEDVHIDL